MPALLVAVAAVLSVAGATKSVTSEPMTWMRMWWMRNPDAFCWNFLSLSVKAPGAGPGACQRTADGTRGMLRLKASRFFFLIPRTGDPVPAQSSARKCIPRT